ncbi:hypothetical protein RDV89_10895 [Nocardioides zeae]|uniref:Uncharacterized protein n=1 Tax=Nocardioides imazamoxiresistens TaxID=3231893 RepID=A0ABU3PWG5_9ACTN|nr:hypothetical protein [Nocardioides zeae]MDT9593576.1 hypothetical protein [Nocardioides zeae]
MPAVRRCSAAAFIVGVTGWMFWAITAAHAPVQTLVPVGGGHGLVVSDLPRILIWGLLVGLGLRSMR